MIDLAASLTLIALVTLTAFQIIRLLGITDAGLADLNRRLDEIKDDVAAIRAARIAEREQRDLEAINADLLRLKQAADRTTAADGLARPSYLRSAVAACERRIATRTREEC